MQGAPQILRGGIIRSLIINIQDREKYAKKVKTLEDQLEKLECAMTEKEKNSEIALGTSKLNYLDPRITVSWCRKNDVPIEKVKYTLVQV